MHCRRVADLCCRVARALSIDGPLEFALALAAAAHRDKPYEPRQTDLVAERKDSSFESRVVVIAEAILHPNGGQSHGKRDREIELGARIFEACDEFDEAVEFAAYNGMSIRAGIDEFFEEAAPGLDSRVIAELRKITSPKTALTLPLQLPVLPTAVGKLLRTSAEDASVYELESIAGSDPVLAGRLLAAANSAYFGFSATIRTLTPAILRLGVPLSRKVLMNACFGPLFASSTLVALWKHSKLVAATAHELAGESGFNQEVAYVAGLLHDIGRVVMHRSPPEIRVDEGERFDAGFPRVYAETLVYGRDHATVGGELLTRWGLPSDIIEAVARHHCPENTNSPLAAILYLAEDEAASDAPGSENLLSGMRHAVAMEIAGIDDSYAERISRQAPIFAVAG